MIAWLLPCLSGPFTFSLHIGVPWRALSPLLNKNREGEKEREGERERPVPRCRANAVCFSASGTVLTVVSIVLRNVLSLWAVSSMLWWRAVLLCQRFFLCLLRWSCDFYSSVWSFCITLNDLQMVITIHFLPLSLMGLSLTMSQNLEIHSQQMPSCHQSKSQDCHQTASEVYRRIHPNFLYPTRGHTSIFGKYLKPFLVL